MIFNGICLVTEDVQRLVSFYEAALNERFERADASFAWLSTPRGTLSIFSTQGMEEMAAGSTKGAGHGGFTIEFEVEDVER